MKVIIAGSRSVKNRSVVEEAIQRSGFDVEEVVSGHARGVDRLGEQWANKQNIPYHVYPAQWDEHGNAAGVIRNDRMAGVADALIAVWDGASEGTKHMVTCMHREHEKPVFMMHSETGEEWRLNTQGSLFE